jgi:hypothetical protein
MSTTLLAWAGVILGGSGLAGMVGMLLRARPEAKKLEAEGAKSLSDSAASLASGFAKDMDSLRAKVDTLEKKLEERDRREDLQERLLQRHERWDFSMAEQVRQLGGMVTDPPPLYPDPQPA